MTSQTTVDKSLKKVWTNFETTRYSRE